MGGRLWGQEVQPGQNLQVMEVRVAWMLPPPTAPAPVHVTDQSTDWLTKRQMSVKPAVRSCCTCCLCSLWMADGVTLRVVSYHRFYGHFLRATLGLSWCDTSGLPHFGDGLLPGYSGWQKRSKNNLWKEREKNKKCPTISTVQFWKKAGCVMCV